MTAPQGAALEAYLAEMLPAVEESLRSAVGRVLENGSARFETLHQMLAYHMGWVGPGSGPEARGKRIRPGLVLLATAAAGADWRNALPAAAAVELVHNFSLIHDDIQDASPLRRGRSTVWKIWGIPQAINAGDLMFTLAQVEILTLDRCLPPGTASEAARMVQQTCLELTQGQYLDIAYETAGEFQLDDYWPMVGGKTAALLSCCAGLGGLIAGVDSDRLNAFVEFGRTLGLAFQVQDDWLGIWGDSRVTGKSTASDLVSGKKTLPVLYGWRAAGRFAQRMAEGPIRSEEAPGVASLLAEEGAESFTRQTADRLTSQALEALQTALPDPNAAAPLREFARRLLDRAG